MSAYKSEAVAGEHQAVRGAAWRAPAGDASGGFTATLIAIPHAMGLGLLAFAALGPPRAAAGAVARLLSVVVGSFVSGVVRTGTCLMMGRAPR